jgi:hypothetical protein
MLTYRPFSWLEVLGGYRWISVDGDGVIDNQAYAADVEVSGWFLGGAVHFGFERTRPEPSLFDD